MKLSERILDLFFVPKCVFCEKVINHGMICPDCEKNLPYCTGVVNKGEFFSCCASAIHYTGIVRDSLLRFKFKGKAGYAKEYAILLADTIKRELSGKYDIITWVPISAKRERERGYDQSKLIARKTAKLLGDEAKMLLKKTRHTQAQSSLKGRDARNANIIGAYEARNKELFSGKRVLLIDDIFTTGATFSECARTLLMAGAEDVVCASVCRAGGE
jgi:ComF family protein